MTMRELLYEAWLSLQAYRMRALLTMLGIIIGIGAVTLMVGIGSGSRKVVEDAIASLGSNMLVVTSSGRMNSKGDIVGMGILTKEDVQAIATLPSLRTVAPSTQNQQQTLQFGGVSWKSEIMGSTPEFFDIRKWKFSAGGSFDASDEQLARRVVVLGSTTAEKLFSGKPAVGEVIKINNLSFEVVGVLAPKGQSLGGRDQDNIAIVPFSTAERRIIGSRNMMSIPMIMMEARSDKMLKRLERDTQNLLRDRHRLKDDQADDFNIRNLTAVAEQAKSTSEALSLLLGAVASISLVVGGIGIMNMMLVAVTERTREIGIRKAIGATENAIMLQFLFEAVIISLCGSIAGLVVGALGLWGAQSLLKLTVEPTLWSFALSIAVAMGVGLVFGYYPARRAAKLPAIEALRYQ